MTVRALSETVQRRILENLRKNVQSDIEKVKELKAQRAAQAAASGIKPSFEFTKDAIRELTDNDQTGVLSTSGLALLARRFEEAKQNQELLITKDQAAIIKKSPKALKDYYNNQVKAGKSFPDIIAILVDEASSILLNPNLLDLFKNYYSSTRSINVLEQSNNLTSVLTIDNLKHAEVNLLFDEFLKKSLIPGRDYLADFIYKNTDAGHVLGIFNQKIIRGIGLEIVSIQNDPNPARISATLFQNAAKGSSEQQINTIFTSMLQLMANADLLSSGLVFTPKIFSKVTKKVYNKSKAGLEGTVVEEVQISTDNQLIGRKLKDAGEKFSKLVQFAQNASFVTPAGSTQQVIRVGDESKKTLLAFFDSLKPLAEFIKELGKQYESDTTVDKKLLNILVNDSAEMAAILADSKGSDALTDMPVKILKSVFDGKKLPAEQKSSALNKIDNKKPKKLTSIPTVKKSSSKTPKIPKIKTFNFRSQTKSLVNLPMLMMQINSNLHDQIKRNMGNGSRKDVLNYRTGRFAQSAKVEKLSESRQGMITAFYSYMKNPYATFSRGGRQERPYTRDPKLLISKSIRELAGQQVANRMRAVLV